MPDSAYEHPMTDPVLEQFVQAVSLEELFHTLEDFHLTFIDLYEGYLIVQNQDGAFEVWPLLQDGEESTEFLPVVQHEGCLYRYSNTYQSKEEIYPRIQHEIGKSAPSWHDLPDLSECSCRVIRASVLLIVPGGLPTSRGLFL